MPTIRRLDQRLADTIRSRLKYVEAERSALRTAYDQALATGRTSATWARWCDERIQDVATAWLLGTVFVSYAEATGLALTSPRTDDARWWWLERFSALAVALGTTPGQVAPRGVTLMPEDGARLLMEFWQGEDGAGQRAAFSTAPSAESRLLGDLYQELSEPARTRYALLQTPKFVEELILDQTLEPAVREVGLDKLKLIDPVCGSGSFLLGSFASLLKHWAATNPGMPSGERVRRSLAALHGTDLNPHAVMISRFRLLITANQANDASPRPSEPWPLQIAVGDSLLGEGDELDNQPDLLAEGSYHVVVGNPPYLTVKDRVVDKRYREKYDVCTGKYSLAVPFIQRFFRLARRDDHGSAGYVGLLTSNSFAKRDFGRRLVEEFLANEVRVTKIIDTSGAFIPGHGTPTLILIGRNLPPASSDSVHLVAGIRGEPTTPSVPSEGQVWQSILRHVTESDQGDQWTESLTLGYAALRSFPWQLSGRAPAKVMRLLDEDHRLGELATRISYLANTGADDILLAPLSAWGRQHTEHAQVVDVVSGLDVRDWLAIPSQAGFFPRTADFEPVDIHDFPGHHRRLWPFRTTLGNRPDFSGRSYFTSNRRWYDWHTIAGTPPPHPPRIAFVWVATHPHFAPLDSPLALPSAPVIELDGRTTPSQQAELVALLNSSTVCFWLKQVSHSKGVSSVHRTVGGGGEPWEDVFEYTPGRLRDLPVPSRISTRYGVELDRLRQLIHGATPAAVVAAEAPEAERLAKAEARWADLRTRMIALVEEQDWAVYALYGLLPDLSLTATPDGVPPLQLGQRAFEVALARRATQVGDIATTWFARHGSTPTTELPDHWPSDYRDLVEARVAAIMADPRLAVLERPEYKRRWATAGWDGMQQQAVRSWILDKCESTTLWYHGKGSSRARARSVSSLADALRSEDSVLEAATLYAPGKDLVEVLRDLLNEASVPCLAAARYKESGIAKWALWRATWRQQRNEDHARSAGDLDAAQQIRDSTPVPPRYASTDFQRPSYWRLRGKHDVPSERFLTFPVTDGQGLGPLLGWSGWNQIDRTQALADLIDNRVERGDADRDSLIGLVAAARETLERVDHESGCVDCADTRDQARLGSWMERLDVSERDLDEWRPAPPRRGRPRKIRAT